MHTLRLKECDFIQYIPAGTWTTETFIVTNKKYDPYFWKAKFPLLRSFWDEVLGIRAGRIPIDEPTVVPEEESESESTITIQLTEGELKELKGVEQKTKKKKRKVSSKNAIFEITSCLIDESEVKVKETDTITTTVSCVPNELQLAIEEMEKNGIPKKVKRQQNNSYKNKYGGMYIGDSEDCLISFD